LAQSIDVNLEGLSKLLDSTPILVDGILNAYDPLKRAINLRENFGPAAEALLEATLGPGVVPTPCIPGLQTCPLPLSAQSAGAPVVIELPKASTPIDDLLHLLGGPTVAAAPAPSSADRVANGVCGIGDFLRQSAGAVVGAS
jgi:hypothetical protein